MRGAFARPDADRVHRRLAGLADIGLAFADAGDIADRLTGREEGLDRADAVAVPSSVAGSSGSARSTSENQNAIRIKKAHLPVLSSCRSASMSGKPSFIDATMTQASK